MLRGCIYLYMLGLIGVLSLIWIWGDRWWFATVLLYGPRWIYAYPMVVLVPAALICQPRLLWYLGGAAVFIGWPLMGLNIPMKIPVGADRPPTFRVMTYNLERWSVTEEEFIYLLDQVKPDFVAVQECAPNRWRMPTNWHVQRGQTSLVLSRYPIVRFEISRRKPDTNGIYCFISTPHGPIGFCCVDLLTPRRALSKVLNDKTVFKLSETEYAQSRIKNRWHESRSLENWIRFFPGPKLIAGDFNLTTDSTIYRKIWATYQNAFSATEFGFGHTKKTKINVFRYKSRIDHILSTPPLRPVACWVGQDMGSDHLPLVADYVFE